MAVPKSTAWSFWWICVHCDKLRRFLVNELVAQRVVWARCAHCTTVVQVCDQHRRERIPVSS